MGSHFAQPHTPNNCANTYRLDSSLNASNDIQGIIRRIIILKQKVNNKNWRKKGRTTHKNGGTKNYAMGIVFTLFATVVMCVLWHVNVEHLFNFVTYWHIRSDAYTPLLYFSMWKCIEKCSVCASFVVVYTIRGKSGKILVHFLHRFFSLIRKLYGLAEMHSPTIKRSKTKIVALFFFSSSVSLRIIHRMRNTHIGYSSPSMRDFLCVCAQMAKTLSKQRKLQYCTKLIQ